MQAGLTSTIKSLENKRWECDCLPPDFPGKSAPGTFPHVYIAANTMLNTVFCGFPDLENKTPDLQSAKKLPHPE